MKDTVPTQIPFQHFPRERKVDLIGRPAAVSRAARQFHDDGWQCVLAWSNELFYDLLKGDRQVLSGRNLKVLQRRGYREIVIAKKGQKDLQVRIFQRIQCLRNHDPNRFLQPQDQRELNQQRMEIGNTVLTNPTFYMAEGLL